MLQKYLFFHSFLLKEEMILNVLLLKKMAQRYNVGTDDASDSEIDDDDLFTEGDMSDAFN